MDLEEKLHRSEMDRRNSLQRAHLLEEQLNTVRGELTDTLGHLEELRDVLQRTQLTADQQQATIHQLTTELRWGSSPQPLRYWLRRTPARLVWCDLTDPRKHVGVGLSSGASSSTGSSIKVSHAPFNKIIVKSVNFIKLFFYLFVFFFTK